MIYVTMYSWTTEEIRIPIYKQIVQLHISNTYGGVMQNEIYCN